MAGDAGARKEIRLRISKSVQTVGSREVDFRPARGGCGKKEMIFASGLHSRANFYFRNLNHGQNFYFALVVGRTTSAQIHGERYGRARGDAIRNSEQRALWVRTLPHTYM